MTKLMQVYRCEICGNMVEVIHTGAGELHCCGQPMSLMREDSVDAAVEKHVPVIEKTPDGYLVKVGGAPHPMEQKHSIEWVELITPDGAVYRQFLHPNEKPEAFFGGVKSGSASARAYCNLHGLWKSGA